MKEAVENSVVNVCENRVDLGAEIGETLLALISGALMGIDNAFNVPTDAMDEFFSSHALAYNIGKILGKSGTIAILSLLAGLFLGGGAAAAGGAALALGGAMVVVSSSVIAIEWSALTAGSLSLFASGHPSGSGEVEEGESDSKVPQKAKDALDKIDKDPETYLEDYYGGIEFKNKPNTKIGETKIPNKNITSYTEYDINPYKYGKPRGTERLVVGRDGSAWYTPDHYKTWY